MQLPRAINGVSIVLPLLRSDAYPIVTAASRVSLVVLTFIFRSVQSTITLRLIESSLIYHEERRCKKIENCRVLRHPLCVYLRQRPVVHY